LAWAGALLFLSAAPPRSCSAFIGVTLGTFVGVLPGIGALATISMCLPITFYLDPMVALIMLAGIFYGAHVRQLDRLDPAQPARQRARGGHLPRRLPDDAEGARGPGAVHHYDRVVRGRLVRDPADDLLRAGDRRLRHQLLVGGLLLDHAARRWSPPRRCPTARRSRASPWSAVGIVLGLVGTDINSGHARYTFGFIELTDGVSLVAVAMGLFGVAEISTR
jgi:putative tricarboxylic transport membrane protein